MVVGDRRESLAAFKQKPPKGGRPARLRRRAVTRAWWEGDNLERINVVLGEDERLSVRITNKGNTMKIYASR